jgi:hypothetical protein
MFLQRALVAMKGNISNLDIAVMLFARQTSRAVRANAPIAPQAHRAKKRRPRSFALQPAHVIRRRFRINKPRGRGMKRCFAEGRERFVLWIAAAVLPNNLMKIAALLAE